MKAYEYEEFTTKDLQEFVTSNNKPFLVVGTEQTDNIDIVLYQNVAELIQVDKSPFITNVGIVKGTFRDDVSVYSFDVDIEVEELVNFNYVYVPVFRRYYFIDDITYVTSRLVTLSLTCDVLMSFKDDIANLYGFIDRNENVRINPLKPYETQELPIPDNKNVVINGYDVDEYEIPNNVFTYNMSDTSNLIISEYTISGFDIKTDNLD